MKHHASFQIDRINFISDTDVATQVQVIATGDEEAHVWSLIQ